jgi:hypothetical protein
VLLLQEVQPPPHLLGEPLGVLVPWLGRRLAERTKAASRSARTDSPCSTESLSRRVVVSPGSIALARAAPARPTMVAIA